jgi:hypothetical protein
VVVEVSGTVEISSGFGLLVSGLIVVGLEWGVVNLLVVVVNRLVVGEESSGFVVKPGVVSGVEVSELISAVVVLGSTVAQCGNSKKSGQNSKKKILGFFRSNTLKNVILHFEGYAPKNPKQFFFEFLLAFLSFFTLCVVSSLSQLYTVGQNGR